jgi:hypothetical protein
VGVNTAGIRRSTATTATQQRAVLTHLGQAADDLEPGAGRDPHLDEVGVRAERERLQVDLVLLEAPEVALEPHLVGEHKAAS